MSFLGNILWIICGGFISGILWLISGIIWCVTIIGIPWGLQCFKMSSLSFAPFGKDVEYSSKTIPLFLNIIYILITGVPMAISNFLLGCVLCITIIGIPWGLQFFKIAKLAFAPFGAKIVRK